MKNIISLITCLVLLIIFPINTLAVQDESNDYADMIAAACEVFPEHAQEIQNCSYQSYARNRSTEESTITYSETRKISDDRVINLTRLSNGTYYITEGTYDSHTVFVDYSSVSQATYVTLNIETIRNDDTYSYFMVENIKYVTYPSAYDVITSTGTPSSRGNFTYKVNTPKLTEDTTHAYLSYTVYYDTGAITPQVIDLRLFVGNNGSQLSETEYDS